MTANVPKDAAPAVSLTVERIVGRHAGGFSVGPHVRARVTSSGNRIKLLIMDPSKPDMYLEIFGTTEVNQEGEDMRPVCEVDGVRLQNQVD